MTIPVAAHLTALGLVTLDVLVRAARIRPLVPGTTNLSLGRAIAVNAYGETAAALTPGRVGGDPARYIGFHRAGVDSAGALAALAVEALIDWVLLLAAAVLLAVLFGDAGAAGVRRLLDVARSPQGRALIAVVLVVTVLGAFVARRLRRRLATAATVPLAAAWQRARQLRWRTVALATALTAVSLVARTAVLPVLVAGHPEIHTGAVVLGSFALLYGQLFLPTPAGVGGVELGFVGGFAGTLSAGELAALLVAWRVYTLILGATLGAVLAARVGLARSLTSRRYSATSSVKVRSQR